MLKILYKKGADEIIGVTIVACNAGEMISEVATAIVGKLGLNKLGGVIHPYPTQADAYGRKLLTDNNKRLLRFLTKLF